MPAQQQLSGLETDAGAEELSDDSLLSLGTCAPAPAFHLARLWPFAFPAQRCRKCSQLLSQDEAVPYEQAPVGWQHRPDECP